MLLGDDVPAIDPILDGPIAAAYDALAARPGPAIVVSDEVGLGIVPMHAGARAYRDLVGIAHQRLAALADEAYLFVAGQPITLKTWTSSDPAALASAFASGEIDLAWVGNSAALAVVERGVGEVFAQMVTDTGSTGYHAIIVTHKDSGLKTLEAAQQPGKGLVFADGETKSFSGHLVPLYYAFVKRGINYPASLYKEVRRGSHIDNLTLAAQRKVDLATANDEELKMLAAKNPDLARHLHILWTSPVIPQSPLIWSTALSLDVRRKVQQVITSFGKHNAADAEVLKQVNNLSAFRKSKNSQLITACDIDMFVAWQQVNRNKDLSEAEKAQRIQAISERASRLELRLKLPPSVA